MEEALKTFEAIEAKCNVKQKGKKKILLHAIVVELLSDLQCHDL